MREDPVRMMRAVRFAAKLGFEIEPATLAAIERHRGDLLKAAMPRLVEETYRTIGQTGAARALVLMEELGLLEQLTPWLSAHLKAEARPLIETRGAQSGGAGRDHLHRHPPPHRSGPGRDVPRYADGGKSRANRAQMRPRKARNSIWWESCAGAASRVSTPNSCG